MGLFSKSCEYALRAVFYIASQSQENRRVGIKEVAVYVDSPEPFLAKILQRLSKDKLVRSIKGPGGGFYLDAADLKRPLADVVRIMEGGSIFNGCAMGLKQCSEIHPCPLHHNFKVIRNQLSDMLQCTTIGEFNEELLSGKTVLKM